MVSNVIKILIFLISFNLFSQNINKCFILPEGYNRIYNDKYSEWLINHSIILNEEVKTYNGDTIKGLGSYYIAKFDYDIGNKNLHQCADAAIYLNAMFNYQVGDWYKIKYHSNNGKIMAYSNFAYASKKNSFKSYLEHVWTWAGTWSLEKYDTYTIDIKDIKPGDIFIIGGSPGHTVIIVDVIKNKENVKKVILAQSYMPAQETHILLNNNYNVWHNLKEDIKNLGFNKDNLKRFKNK